MLSVWGDIIISSIISLNKVSLVLWTYNNFFEVFAKSRVWAPSKVVAITCFFPVYQSHSFLTYLVIFCWKLAGQLQWSPFSSWYAASDCLSSVKAQPWGRVQCPGVTRVSTELFFIIKKIICKGYTAFIVITEYWLSSPCCMTHPGACLYPVVCVSHPSPLYLAPPFSPHW